MVKIKKLESKDLSELIGLINFFHDAFEMQPKMVPQSNYLQSLLDKPGLTFLVAIDIDTVVGGLTAHDLPSIYFESNEVYVYDLAVSKTHRRQGVGTRLLAELKTICESKNQPEFFLQAEADDTLAVEFYRSLDVFEQQAVHFSFNTNV